MKYECSLCMITPGKDRLFGDREEIREHLLDHGLPEDSVPTYLREVPGEQTTLTEAA